MTNGSIKKKEIGTVNIYFVDELISEITLKLKSFMLLNDKKIGVVIIKKIIGNR